jgi:hypothetical protein
VLTERRWTIVAERSTPRPITVDKRIRACEPGHTSLVFWSFQSFRSTLRAPKAGMTMLEVVSLSPLRCSGSLLRGLGWHTRVWWLDLFFFGLAVGLFYIFQIPAVFPGGGAGMPSLA